MADLRSYANFKYGLELDGVKNGYITSVEGGNAKADRIDEKLGHGHFFHKHLGIPSWADIKLGYGGGMSKAVVQWIKDTLAFAPTRKNGRIVSLDQHMKVQYEKTFTEALISEIGFPAMDASAKEACSISLSFSPVKCEDKKGDDKGFDLPQDKNQKTFTTHNFKLTIDGMDCKKISKVDGFTIKQKFATDAIGDQRIYDKVPSVVEFPDLKVTFSSATQESWIKWHKQMVVDGQGHGGEAEKQGSLEYLAPDGKPIFTLKFMNIGIMNLSNDKFEGKGDQVAKMTADMYVEQIAWVDGTMK